MKNLFFFLLGFFLVFAAGISFAGTPLYTFNPVPYYFVENNGYYSPNVQVTCVVNLCTSDNLQCTVVPGVPQNWTYPKARQNYYHKTRISDGVVFGVYTNQMILPPNTHTFTFDPSCTSCPSGSTFDQLTGTCSVPCSPPKFFNPHGECVLCPSGEFMVGDNTCIPLCDYSHPYEPGNLYNPGSGTCVQPPCGSGQELRADGRCYPNCPEGKKLDVVTGACVADCPFGTTWDGSTCKNDCPDGQMKDGETGACINVHDCLPGEEIVNGVCAYKCLEGETRKPDGSCTSVPPNCPFGQHEENGKCVATDVSCPDGTSFDTVSLKCKAAPVVLVENKTKTTAPDGTITETTTETTTITTNAGPGSPSGSASTGTVQTTTTTNPTTGATTSNSTFTPPNVAKYESPPHTLNWSGWNSQIKRAAEEGPVRLLNHVIEIVAWLDVTPVAPVFHPIVAGHEFTIDLSIFDPLAEACRFFLSAFMTIGVFWFGYRLFGLI